MTNMISGVNEETSNLREFKFKIISGPCKQPKSNMNEQEHDQILRIVKCGET